MRIGSYEVLRKLGQGGMGVVLEARAPSGEHVAIKLMRYESVKARARFDRERRLLAEIWMLEGFVSLVTSGESDQGPYFVMPLMRGGTLRERLGKTTLPVDDAIRCVRTLAARLGVAHERGIVHRDLKPENILFDERGAPLIADLGLAKHFAGSAMPSGTQLTKAGHVCGTIGYMAPEQLRDSRSVGPPADVFALGAILYECLAGRPAFAGTDLLEVAAAIDRGKLEPLARLRPETPGPIVAAVERALSREASRRYASAGELARALEVPATPVKSPAPRPAPTPRRRTTRPSAKRPRSSAPRPRSSAPRPVSDLLARALARRRDGDLRGAIRDLERALAAAPSGPLAPQITAKLGKLRKSL